MLKYNAKINNVIIVLVIKNSIYPPLSRPVDPNNDYNVSLYTINNDRVDSI